MKDQFQKVGNEYRKLNDSFDRIIQEAKQSNRFDYESDYLLKSALLNNSFLTERLFTCNRKCFYDIDTLNIESRRELLRVKVYNDITNDTGNCLAPCYSEAIRYSESIGKLLHHSNDIL